VVCLTRIRLSLEKKGGLKRSDGPFQKDDIRKIFDNSSGIGLLNIVNKIED
jgi:hypothetical protein